MNHGDPVFSPREEKIMGLIRIAARRATCKLLDDRERDRKQRRKARQAYGIIIRQVKRQRKANDLTRLMWCDRCYTRQLGSTLKRGVISSSLTCKDKAACSQRRRNFPTASAVPPGLEP